MKIFFFMNNFFLFTRGGYDMIGDINVYYSLSFQNVLVTNSQLRMDCKKAAAGQTGQAGQQEQVTYENVILFHNGPVCKTMHIA